jgi:hypothetical protein
MDIVKIKGDKMNKSECGKYWVDDNNNSWSVDYHTIEQAMKYSKSLIDCSYCCDCSYCRYCRDCIDCSNCRYCRDCSNCSGCSDFTDNPERITSPKIGSRNDQTTVYFLGDKVQVVCGLYKGNLASFRDAVIAEHGENEHAKAYLLWIGRVEQYIKFAKSGQ